MLKIVRLILGAVFGGMLAATCPIGGAIRGAVRLCLGDAALARADSALDAIVPSWADAAFYWGWDARADYCAAVGEAERWATERLRALKSR